MFVIPNWVYIRDFFVKDAFAVEIIEHKVDSALTAAELLFREILGFSVNNCLKSVVVHISTSTFFLAVYRHAWDVRYATTRAPILWTYFL